MTRLNISRDAQIRRSPQVESNYQQAPDTLLTACAKMFFKCLIISWLAAACVFASAKITTPQGAHAATPIAAAPAKAILAVGLTIRDGRGVTSAPTQETSAKGADLAPSVTQSCAQNVCLTTYVY